MARFTAFTAKVGPGKRKVRPQACFGCHEPLITGTHAVQAKLGGKLRNFCCNACADKNGADQ